MVCDAFVAFPKSSVKISFPAKSALISGRRTICPPFIVKLPERVNAVTVEPKPLTPVLSSKYSALKVEEKLSLKP